MPPFMGQGMCSGIRDALNLSWKLAAVMRGEADDALLDTYESERAPHVRGLTEISMAFGEMVLLRDPETARQRDDMLRAGNLPTPPMFPRLGSRESWPADRRTNWAAPSVASRRKPGSPSAGGSTGSTNSRPAGGSSPGTRSRTRCSTTTNVTSSPRSGMDISHVSRGPGPGYYIDIDGEYDRWFQANKVRAFVQRPDGYIFGTARTVADLPAVLDELADVLAATVGTDRRRRRIPQPKRPSRSPEARDDRSLRGLAVGPVNDPPGPRTEGRRIDTHTHVVPPFYLDLLRANRGITVR